MNSPDLPEVGARARLRRGVDRFPHFCVEARAIGTVTEASAWLVALRMDEPVIGAEQWDNELCWTADDAPSESIGNEFAAAAAFHRDAELLDPGRHR